MMKRPKENDKPEDSSVMSVCWVLLCVPIFQLLFGIKPHVVFASFICSKTHDFTHNIREARVIGTKTYSPQSHSLVKVLLLFCQMIRLNNNNNSNDVEGYYYSDYSTQ
jgi:hypothetical protein